MSEHGGICTQLILLGSLNDVESFGCKAFEPSALKNYYWNVLAQDYHVGLRG